MLAQCGFGSLRGLEEQIIAGRITVNRLPAEVGQKVGPEDQIRINGEVVRLRFAPPRARVLIYHKPAGEIVTRSDPEGRPTVFDKLPRVGGSKWIAIGRLDFNSEGLLLFTTSGELANRLMHPRYEIEREYAVRIMGTLTQEQEKQLREGIKLEDGEAKVLSLSDGGGEGANHWYTVVLAEGRNREVRRLFEALGLMVSRLIRTRYGIVNMPSQLKRGDVLELDAGQLNQLLTAAGMIDPEPDETLSDSIGNRAPEGMLYDPDDESRDVDGNRALPPSPSPGNGRDPNSFGNFRAQDGRDRAQGRNGNAGGYREKNGNVAPAHAGQPGNKYAHQRSGGIVDGNRASTAGAPQSRGDREFGGQARGKHKGNGQPRGAHVRGGPPRDGQASEGQARNAQQRDGQVREGQTRDGQPRNGQARDGQPRGGNPRGNGRGGQSRNPQGHGQPRHGQPRGGQAREAQGGHGEAPGDQAVGNVVNDTQASHGQTRNGQGRGHSRGPKPGGGPSNSRKPRNPQARGPQPNANHGNKAVAQQGEGASGTHAGSDHPQVPGPLGTSGTGESS